LPIPNDEMAAEAERGLEWRREYGRGGTEVGVARARDIANKRDLSMDTVRRMNSYFARHEVDKEAEGFRPGEDGYPSAGRIAWALWSGDAGMSWAKRIIEQEDDERSSFSLFLSSLRAKLASSSDASIRSFLSDYIAAFNLVASRADAKVLGDKVFISAAIDVLAGGDWFEVGGVDARSVAAEMVNVMSSWDWSDNQLITEAVGWREDFSASFAADNKVPVASTSLRACPVPAVVLASALVNLGPKTIRSGKLAHSCGLLSRLPNRSTGNKASKETRPYEGEHAARIRDPEGFDSFRRVNNEGGQGVDFVYGIRDGEALVQSIRFKVEYFTEAQAREWLDANDFEPLLFEPAVPMDDSRSNVVSSRHELEAPKMAQAEIRALNEAVELRQEGDGPIRVAGYAAVFNQETNIGGYFTETIAPGAFTSALDRGDDVVLLINHEGLPLARTRSGTLKLTQDQRGLYIESELDPSDPDVRAIVPKMKRGDLDKMSFAFIPTKQSWDERGEIPKRMIEDLQLFDVAIVTTPAYDGTEIGLRSLEKYRDEKRKGQAARRLRMKAKLHE
jgi:hypothetical protein